MGTVEATVRTLAFALHELGTLELRSDMSNMSAVPKRDLEVGDESRETGGYCRNQMRENDLE